MNYLLELRIGKIFLCVFSILLMSGCQSTGASNTSSACDSSQTRNITTAVEKKLSYGVLTYEEGNYQASIMALQGVLNTGISSKAEKVKAYKYLAFIQCVSGREAMCRDYFKKALELDPIFNLDIAEAGHPIWGPVFRSVKNKAAR